MSKTAKRPRDCGFQWGKSIHLQATKFRSKSWLVLAVRDGDQHNSIGSAGRSAARKADNELNIPLGPLGTGHNRAPDASPPVALMTTLCAGGPSRLT